MSPETRALHLREMAFFKDVHARYHATLDECGEISKSLSRLKIKLTAAGKPFPSDKWERLSNALRTGEIIRGKKSTPGDWAASEVRLSKASR